MSNLELHAKKEMEIAGLFGKDSDYGGLLGEAVMKMVKVFADEGHTGLSANMAINIFQKVARFEPLTPLTGADNEWMEVGPGIFQNTRCSHVFKEGGEAYDSNGKIFREPEEVMQDKEISAIAKDRADWLVDAVATATQERMFLRGDIAENTYVTEALLLNAEKAIEAAIRRALTIGDR